MRARESTACCRCSLRPRPPCRNAQPPMGQCEQTKPAATDTTPSSVSTFQVSRHVHFIFLPLAHHQPHPLFFHPRDAIPACAERASHSVRVETPQLPLSASPTFQPFATYLHHHHHPANSTRSKFPPSPTLLCNAPPTCMHPI